ncbi:unnamed protein product [Orchesella dallaii]|uniref:Uncharacterized protein n=1 Tax=Orchesella dallaii TaxID=48710 RepID=A0ABP1RIY2_9HEXA
MCLSTQAIPYIPIQLPSSWLDRLVKVIVCIGLILLGIYFIGYHSRGEIMEKPAVFNTTKRIECYHCISTSKNLSYPDMLVEEKCKYEPTNLKLCEEGETCWSSEFGMHRTFMRLCMQRIHYKEGCTNLTKPWLSTTCICNTNRCL